MYTDELVIELVEALEEVLAEHAEETFIIGDQESTDQCTCGACHDAREAIRKARELCPNLWTIG